MPKPSSQMVIEDREQGVICEVSDSECYWGFPESDSTTVADSKWKVFRRKKITVGTSSVYVGSYADGNENYDNAFNPSTAEGITAIQGLTYPDWDVIA